MIANIVLFLWPMVAAMLFVVLSPRRACLASVIAGWLLLPVAGIKLPGLPDYSKSTAVVLGAMLGVALFDFARLLSFRFRWFDIPMFVWCVVPGASSLTNDLGPYDALSSIFNTLVLYGIPYFLGRLYFTSREALLDLVYAICLGGMFYVPFCLWEIRMSPNLHKTVYGFAQTKFHMVVRLGGYRPMVFMQHGIALGAWMSAAAISAVWLWRTRSIRAIYVLPIGLVALGMVVMLVMCRALNGYMIFAIAIPFVFFVNWRMSRIALAILVMAPVVYCGARSLGWDARIFVDVAETVSTERAGSLESRIEQEVLLIDKAVQRPFFGWGTWGRNRVQEEARRQLSHASVTDSLWIITVGQRGYVGLIALGTVLLLPLALVLARAKNANRAPPLASPAGVLAMIVFGFAIDCLFNAMLNPVFLIAVGAVVGTTHPFGVPRPGKAL